MKLTFTILATLILISSCSKSNLELQTPRIEIPEPEAIESDSCISKLRPGFVCPEFTVTDNVSCPNYLQFQFFGNFGINESGDWSTEINCIQNPTNWKFAIQDFGNGFKCFEILIHYPTYVPDDGGPSVYLSGTNLKINLASGECGNVDFFKYTSGANEGHRIAHFNIFMSNQYWECYTDGEAFDFDFFVTGTYDFPIEE
jgi:hypothetical protein